MSKKDILICAIARLENDYIREWVEYHKNIGVDNICLCDNNRGDEERFEDVIGDYIESGFVILKDYRDVLPPCQTDCYTDCYTEYKDEYKWIGFIDIDEFVFTNRYKNLKDYLSEDIFNGFNMIHLNWLMYGDDGILDGTGKPVLWRGSKPINVNLTTNLPFPDTYHVKSFIRGGLDSISWENAHTANIEGRVCNGSGIECENKFYTPYDFTMAGIMHFTTKTAKEYIKKLKRGFCDDNHSISKEYMVKLFFKRNEVTKEKLELFRDELGVDLLSFYNLADIEKNKDIQIYSLCYSKKDYAFYEDSVVTPLQVGAANGTNVCPLKDNTGDNISDENYFFVENTGTYWIWKNITDLKYKGQMQYRRQLSGITEETNFDEIFEKYDVITCEPFYHPDHKNPTETEQRVIIADTVEQGYAFSHCIDDLYIMEMVVKSKYPEYAESYDKYIKNGANLYYSNGFIMKSENFDGFCEFLFSCLRGFCEIFNIKSQKDIYERVKYNIEVGKYPKYSNGRATDGEIRWQTEMGGFLSERLWTLWLLHNFPEDKIYKTPYNLLEEGMYT